MEKRVLVSDHKHHKVWTENVAKVKSDFEIGPKLGLGHKKENVHSEKLKK